jgi:hypothetical protein
MYTINPHISKNPPSSTLLELVHPNSARPRLKTEIGLVGPIMGALYS